jgi:hypothetical protein
VYKTQCFLLQRVVDAVTFSVRNNDEVNKATAVSLR